MELFNRPVKINEDLKTPNIVYGDLDRYRTYRNPLIADVFYCTSQGTFLIRQLGMFQKYGYKGIGVAETWEQIDSDYVDPFYN